jgi:hypothetical protein
MSVVGLVFCQIQLNTQFQLSLGFLIFLDQPLKHTRFKNYAF